MNPEKQRIAIAEFCGWKCSPPNRSWPQPYWTDPNSRVLKVESELPDYLNDLNAMHEAETRLKPQQWRIYSDKLMVLVRDSDITLNGSNIESRYKTAHATAAQRAEALLRTIGKWQDDTALKTEVGA